MDTALLRATKELLPKQRRCTRTATSDTPRAARDLPTQRDCDAVRFSVSRENESRISLVYVCERNHEPAGHGKLDSESRIERCVNSHPDRAHPEDGGVLSASHGLSRIQARLRITATRTSMTEPDRLAPRPVSDSQSEMAEIVLPNDANPLGALLGGRLMHWIDLAGAMAAHRHSRNYVVTASIDHIDFLVPVHVGDPGDAALVGQSRVPHLDGSRREGLGGELHRRTSASTWLRPT